MANDAAVTQTINIVPVQGIFQPEPTFALVTLIGPAGTPFYANINPNQSGLHITNSTIDSSPIGSITPSTGVFTNVDLTTGTITSAPSGPTSIVNQAYVDAVAQGLSFKQPANYTTTANITLAGLSVQAGGDWPATLTAGDRILVKDQSTSANNGIYVASSSTWSRAADANAYSEYIGAYLFVLSGTSFGGSSWVCTNQPGGTLGVTPITFIQFANNATYTAGTGLTLTGYQFSITNVGTAGTYGSASQVPVFVTNAQGQVTSVTNTSIAIAGSQITSGTIDSARLSGSYTGITGVGTLTAGTWNAGTIGVAYGGTGVSTLTAGYVKANGTTPFSTVATIPNTDITGLGTMSTQNANNVAITGGSAALSTLKTLGLTGYLYGNDTGAVTASTTIPSSAISGLGTMATQNANNVAITGGTITGLTQLGADYLQFNTGATVTPALGKIWWDGGTTLNVGMTTNVVGLVNESEFVYVKASSAITKGQLCYHTGAVGGSGVITAAPTPLSLADPNQIIGVAAEDIANNAFGLIQIGGTLRGFNTTGSSVGETWADGDPLYYNPAYVGGLTKNKPSAPNQKTYIGEVINAASGGAGSISIRIAPGSTLGGTDSNVQFGTVSTNNLIQYNGTYWTNIAPSALTGVGSALNLSNGGAGQIPYQSASSTTSFLAAGTTGQVLTSNGTSAPSWTTPTAYATVTDDTTTNATRYPLFANQTAGNLTTEYVSSTKLQFNPSTGVFTSTSFSGAGTGLTGTASGLSIGGNAATATSATSAITATNLAGGANGSLPYQTGSGATTFLAAGTNGYVLTLTGGVPTWAAAASSGITISDDTTTNATRYLTFTSATTGSITTENVSSTKLQFNPSTGTFTAAGSVNAGGTGANTMPVGTVAQRPGTPSTGMFRFNSAGVVEVYNGSTWQFLSTVSSYSASYLVIGGGGGGGASTNRVGGGGGAGGLLSGSTTLNIGTTYSFVVGGGGAGGTSGGVGSNGTSSTGLSLTAVGGGYGGQYTNGGASGGSGGGGSADTGPGSGTSGQGSAGGNGYNSGSASLPFGGGGGGGAGGTGGNASSSTSGTSGSGGSGTANSITGSSVTYAGGGSGGAQQNGNTGYTVGAVTGGGGAGGLNAGAATAGSTNTGGGGGGASRTDPPGTTQSGASGGSGVVIISVPTLYYSGTTTGSPTVTTSGSNTILKFTSSGSYTA